MEKPSLWHNVWLHRIVAAAMVLPIAPAAVWMQNAGGMEGFNVLTAQETLRHGNWLLPTIAGDPRLQKPPLVQWITALGLRSSHSIDWGARWPSLIVSAIWLVGIYELGRVLDDWRTGLCAAAICATSMMFVRYGWQAYYDAHLSAWVTWTNVFLAQAIFGTRRWRPCLLAGAMLGLALMSKGPPAFLQTVVPVAVFTGYKILSGRRVHSTIAPETVAAPLQSDSTVNWKRWLGPAAGGTVIMVLIAAPWPIYALIKSTHLTNLWYIEMSLKIEAEVEKRPGYWNYIGFPFFLLPWSIWFVVGLIEIARVRPRRHAQRMWMAVLWVIVPIAIMFAFPARRERYLMPMIGTECVIAAFGVSRAVPARRQWDRTQKWLVASQGIILIFFAFVHPLWGAISAYLPIPAAMRWTGVNGSPSYSPALASAAALVSGILLILAVAWYRRNRFGLVGGSYIVLAPSLTLILWSFTQTQVSPGRRMAAAIDARYPDAQVFNANPPARPVLPHDLLIYLDRDVPRVDDARSLPPAPRAQVLIYPPPLPGTAGPPVPPGFALIDREQFSGLTFMAFGRAGSR